MDRLKQRRDFLAAANAVKVATAGFVLQARDRGDAGPIRIGFTVSRKVGTAVERNRVRRRLKDIVGRSPAEAMQAGHDYVVVGRRSALSRCFARMAEDFAGALQRLARPAGRQAPSGVSPYQGSNTGT